MAEGEDAPLPERRTLRSGWTTGTCATAAAAAACEALFTGAFPDPVLVRLPRGGEVRLPLHRAELRLDAALASVIKDAGDDPDVTHGAEVVVSVSPAPAGTGVAFRAGEGVGRVTLPGLPIPPGEPAINPGPRAMIREAIAAVAARCGGRGDVTVTISIPGGEALAAKTLNGRLGILGGLSILGTTGIVQPYSCAAWIHSIHRGIDVARAAGLGHVAAATGSVSEASVRRLYQLPEVALIDMGDFAGGMLKYVKRHPLPRLTLAGGFGKLAKLAQGHLYLHSSKTQVDIGDLAAWLGSLGAPRHLVEECAAATSAAQVLARAEHSGLPLASLVAERARAIAGAAVADETAIEVIVYDRVGRMLGRAGFER